MYVNTHEWIDGCGKYACGFAYVCTYVCVCAMLAKITMYIRM